MANVATLVANLRMDTRDFDSGMARAERSASNTGRSMMRAGSMMTMGVTVPFGLAAVAAVRFASDAEEAANKVRVVFGARGARVIEEWASTAAESMGLSSAAAMDAAGTFGKFFRGMGMAVGPARDMSTAIVQLAGDMASFHNADPSEMLMALRSGLSGETEPLRRFGINMTEASLAAYAMQQGITESVSSMSDAERAQLRYSFILSRTTQEQGDFGRTSDGAANSMRTLKAQAADVGAAFGSVLLPMAQSAMNALKGLAEWMMNLSPGVRTAIVAIMGLGAVVGPLIVVVGGLVTAITAIGLPVIAIAAAIAALVAGLIYAYFHFDGFRNIVDAAFQAIGAAAAWFVATVVPALVGAFQYVVAWVQTNWPAIRDTVLAILGGIQAYVGAWIAVAQGLWSTFGDTILGYIRETFENLRQIINGALNVVAGIIRTVMAVIRGDWGAAWNGIKQAIAGVWQVIQGVVRQSLNIVQTLISGAWDAVRRVTSTAWDGVKTLVSGAIDALVGFFRRLPGRLASIGSGMFDFLKEAFRSAINFIIDGWNSLDFEIPRFDPPGPGPTFGPWTIGLPDIPHLAKGGRITKGGAALVGEKGAEVVSLPRGAAVHPTGSLNEMEPVKPLDPNNEIDALIASLGDATSVIDKDWVASMRRLADAGVIAVGTTQRGFYTMASDVQTSMSAMTVAVTAAANTTAGTWQASTGQMVNDTTTSMASVGTAVLTGVTAADAGLQAGARTMNHTWSAGLGDLRATTNTVLAGSDNSVLTRVQGAVGTIGDAWDRIGNRFRDPLNRVQTRIVNAFLGNIRDVAALVGESGSIPGNMPALPTFHSGGVVGGAGEVLALLQSGEIVLDRDTVRALSGEGGKGRNRSGDGPGAGLTGVFARLADKDLTVPYSQAESTFDRVESSMRGLVGQMIPEIMGRIGTKLNRPAVASALEMLPALRRAMAPPVFPGMGYEAMWQVVSGAFPWAQLFSGMRPGAITATGNASYHGMGRAIDITPSMEIFDWLLQYANVTKELIFSPAGGRQIHNGSPHMYGEPTRGDHWDHIHWAVANGMEGIVRRPTSFLAGEAGPEAVQVRPLRGAASGGGGGTGTEIHVHLNGRATQEDGQAVVDALVAWQRSNGAVPVTVTG